MSFTATLAGSALWFRHHAAVVFAVAAPTLVVVDAVVRTRRSGRAHLAALRDAVVSATAFLVTKQVAATLVFASLSVAVYDHLRLTTLDLTSWQVWLAVFLARDLVYYFVHRAEHRFSVLWASHQVHHAPASISAATAVQVPWMEALYKPWFSLWMPLVGFHPAAAVALDVVAALLGILQHTGAFTRTTVLDAVFVTPATHRVHHGSNPEYLDCNFGAVLVVWDRLFGTYRPESVPVRFGLVHAAPAGPRATLTGGYPALAAQLRATGPRHWARTLAARPGVPVPGTAPVATPAPARTSPSGRTLPARTAHALPTGALTGVAALASPLFGHFSTRR